MFISAITGLNLINHRNTLREKNNQDNVQFRGMTKIFKNRIFLDGQKDIAEILQKRPNTRAVVGQLPEFMFKKLPVDKRRESILEILDTFDEVVHSIRDFEPTAMSSIDEIQNKRPKKANELLTGVLQKWKVISPWDDVNIEYIDAGGKGKVFKLSGLRDSARDDEFVIKVFHQIKAKNWQPFKSHGCYAEINNGIYWRAHEGMDTHRGKFYFASMDSGYMVSKFLDEDVRLPQRVVPEYKYGIKCTDEEKDGPLVGYNRIKGYNYDYGGMRVVNRLKNSDKGARKYLEMIKQIPLEQRAGWWLGQFAEKHNSESKNAGLALGIKYLNNKSQYIDMCLGLNSPKVNQALAYVLKYLPYKDGVKYFEKLVQTDDKVTQIILFNEIPLLSKRKAASVGMKDDITATLKEILPARIHKYYLLAEQYALPETIEHLASFVHLLPHEVIPAQHMKLANIDNYALQDRLLWKFNFIPDEYKDILAINMSLKVKNPELQEKMLSSFGTLKQETLEQVKFNLDKH